MHISFDFTLAFGECQFDEKLYVYLPAALMPNASYGFQLFIKLGIGMFENWPTAIATKVAKTMNLMIIMADWKCQKLFLSPFLYRGGILVT